jgi:hypothetical protein
MAGKSRKRHDQNDGYARRRESYGKRGQKNAKRGRKKDAEKSARRKTIPAGSRKAQPWRALKRGFFLLIT